MCEKVLLNKAANYSFCKTGLSKCNLHLSKGDSTRAWLPGSGDCWGLLRSVYHMNDDICTQWGYCHIQNKAISITPTPQTFLTSLCNSFLLPSSFPGMYTSLSLFFFFSVNVDCTFWNLIKWNHTMCILVWFFIQHNDFESHSCSLHFIREWYFIEWTL